MLNSTYFVTTLTLKKMDLDQTQHFTLLMISQYHTSSLSYRPFLHNIYGFLKYSTFKGINRSTLLDYKLVIALWDKDMIGNDEYMAGVRLFSSKNTIGLAGFHKYIYIFYLRITLQFIC